MNDTDSSRSGLHSAVNLARAGKAAANIAKGASVGGVQGAAVAAAKEAMPLLVKLALCILITIFVIPMIVFTALPNIFFGYDNATALPVVDMTAQAMTIGGAYMSVEDFERTQIDTIVTSLIHDYEESGTTIDRVEIISSFDENDLIWLVSINSVSHQQDLSTMSAEDIRSLCISRLTYTPSLLFGGGDSQIITLKVHVQKLEPDRLMQKLGFDDEAQTWAKAFHETLVESDALKQYAPYFSAYRPDYSGDNSYNGDIEHGNAYDNGIDVSAFISPHTKNNLDLVSYAIQAYQNNWGYVWGTYGNILTQSLFDYKLQQYPDGVGNYEDFIRDNWLGRHTTDCVGLIKGYGWLDADDLSINYATNGMPDYGANRMYQAAKDSGSDYGSMATMPEIPGLALWKEGHIGVYIGGGYAIEAMGTKYGVVKTEVGGRGWQGWCKLPYITYLEED